MLTEAKCRSAAPGPRPLKLFDGHGLHLLVTRTGFKSWRLKYRFGGREKQLTLGPYPAVTLKQARELRDQALAALREGTDPGAAAKARRARRHGSESPEPTLREFALRWLALQADGWKPKHARDVARSLEDEVFPTLGARPIAAIRPGEVRELLEAIQARGAIETAHRIRARLSAVFALAIASDAAASDPAASLGAALRPIVKRRLPAVLDLRRARAFLHALEALPGQPAIKLASRLLALTAARPGMVRWAEAGDFTLDGEAPVWRVPAAKMKLERAQAEQEAFDFVLPLSRQAVETVRAALAEAGRRKYLFPSIRHSHRPISENALNAAYRRVPGFGGRHVPHGWRSTFSTIMNERALDMERPGDRAVIDLMLAHKPQGVEATYNRAAYMKRRRELAQEWADLLLAGLPPSASLLDGPRR